MKRHLVLFLAFVMLFSLAACGGTEKVIDQNLSKSETVTTTESKGKETTVYGIGEEAKSGEISITIDKVEAPDTDILLNSAKEGYEYLQVHYTFKNISSTTIETPKKKAIYIVYEEGDTGDSSEMTSEEGFNVLPGGEKDSMYWGNVELAPGESVSGWMLYQRLADQKEVTMHFYSGYINVAPDLVFKFSP